MIKRTLLRGSVERPLNGLIWAMLILSCSLFINPQTAQSGGTCTTQDSSGMTIAAGGFHTVGLKEDGTVVSTLVTGANDFGQWDVSSWRKIKAVAAGRDHTVGLTEDGTVVAVGKSDDDQLKVNTPEWTNIKAIAAGWFHTVGLTADGTVVAAGKNYAGENNVYDKTSWTNIKAIAAGAYHTVGLKEDGTVVATGQNGSGQTNVSTWTNIKAIAIAAGGYQTVGIKEDGTLVATGNTGDVSTWKNIKAAAAGGSLTAGLTVGLEGDGTVVAVGSGGDVSTWKNITAVASGLYQTVGLRADGTVVAVLPAGKKTSGQTDTSGWTNIKQPTSGITDNTPPEMKISVTPGMLWPPNHQMVTVTPKIISVTDNCDPAPKVNLLSVTSSEPDNGLGDGDTANDIVQNSNGTISLRAERSGKVSERTYTITYQATDASGNTSTATATVTVPHNK